MIPKIDTFHKVLEEDIIGGVKVPIRIIVLGHILTKMTHFDYMAFAGADSETYIKYCENDGPVLMYSLKTQILSEIVWETETEDLKQIDWDPTRICG